MSLRMILGSFLTCFLFAGSANAQTDCQSIADQAQKKADAAWSSCQNVKFANKQCAPLRQCKRDCRIAKRKAKTAGKGVKRDCKTVAKNAFNTCKNNANQAAASCRQGCAKEKRKFKRKRCERKCNRHAKKDCRQAKRKAMRDCRNSYKGTKGTARGNKKQCANDCRKKFLSKTSPCWKARKDNRDNWAGCGKAAFLAAKAYKAQQDCEKGE
jgi:hypothetical protein